MLETACHADTDLNGCFPITSDTKAGTPSQLPHCSDVKSWSVLIWTRLGTRIISRVSISCSELIDMTTPHAQNPESIFCRPASYDLSPSSAYSYFPRWPTSELCLGRTPLNFNQLAATRIRVNNTSLSPNGPRRVRNSTPVL